MSNVPEHSSKQYSQTNVPGELLGGVEQRVEQPVDTKSDTRVVVRDGIGTEVLVEVATVHAPAVAVLHHSDVAVPASTAGQRSEIAQSRGQFTHSS